MTAPITCPDTARLREHLAEPRREVEDHLTDCTSCAGLIEDRAARAGTVTAALDMLVAPPSTLDDLDPVGAASAALADRSTPNRRAPAGRAADRVRWLAVASVAALAVVFLVTPGGRSAVAQAVDAFRPERVQVVNVDLDEAMTAVDEGADLADLLDIDVISEPDRQEVPDGATASAVAGVDLPDLSGSTIQPTVFGAVTAGEVRLTLLDPGDGSIDPELVGSQLVVHTPSLAVAIEGDVAGVAAPLGDRDAQGRVGDAIDGAAVLTLEDSILGVARSGALEVDAIGAPLEDIRDYLLERPEVPPSIRSQLEGIADWRRTLPFPVSDAVDIPWRQDTLDGQDVLLFGDETGLASAAVRLESGGGVTVVAGTLRLSQAVDILAGL